MRGAARVHFPFRIDDEVEHRGARDRVALLARVGRLRSPQPRELSLQRRHAERAPPPEGRVDGLG